MGTLALLIAIMEYRNTLRYLWSQEFRDVAGIEKRSGFTPLLLVATLLALVGIVTLVAVLVQLLAESSA